MKQNPLAVVALFAIVGGVYTFSGMSGEQRQATTSAIADSIPELPSAIAQPNSQPSEPDFAQPMVPAMPQERQPAPAPEPKSAPAPTQPRTVTVSTNVNHYIDTSAVPGYSGSNFRGGPGSDYEMISGPIPEGEGVYLTGNWQGNWAEADYDGQRGWIFVP